jgi:phosphatidylglycerophosphatase A
VRALVIFLATAAGAGYAPVASGTVGTLLAVPLFPVLARLCSVSPLAYALVLAVIIAGSIWVAGAAGPIFGEPDSGRIVIDEVAGYLVATAFLEFSWSAAIIAFLFFRLFDIVKPFPASWFDEHHAGGIGVVGDDLVAGVYAAIATRIVLALMP